MPIYSKADIDFLPEREDLLLMVDAVESHRDKFLLVLLWMTGARPSELAELRKEDCEVKEDEIIVKMPIKKRRRGRFTVKDRVFKFERPQPPDKDVIIDYVLWYLEYAQPGRFFVISTRTMENIVLKASKKGLRRNLCPYNFRHGRLTMLGRSGATIDQLMQFKGATDMRSITPYIHARPFKVKI